MDLKDLVEIGGKIEILFKQDPLETLKGFSMVQDITDEDELIITLPTFGGLPILLNLEDRIKVFFFRDEGSFVFDGEVIRRFKVENAVLIGIKQITPMEKIQRRSFYRLRTALHVEFTIKDEGSRSGDEEIPLLKGICLDISGSGMRLCTDHKLHIHTIIECNLNLGNAKQILLPGKVVRVGWSEGLLYKYVLGVRFQNVTERTRDTLIKFIFKRQGELRKKGLI